MVSVYCVGADRQMKYRLLLTAPTPDQADEKFRVLEWHCQPGGQCEKGELLVELETGKAVLELRPCRTVTLRTALAKDGEWVKPGQIFALLSDLPDESLPNDPTEFADLPLDLDEL